MKNIKKKNFSNFLIILLLVITSLAIIYTFLKDGYYKSDGQSSDYTFYYKVLFCSLFLMLVTILMLSEKIKRYFLIITFSSIAGLYFHEIMIRSSIFKKVDLSLPKNFDQRNSSEIVSNLNKENKKAFNLITPTNFLFSDGLKISNQKLDKKIFPLAGVSNVLTPLCNELGEWIVYKSDRFGFNNPDKNWDNLNTEILIIGDSFAHGACAEKILILEVKLKKQPKKL